MTCGHCQHDNDEAARFCSECGAPLATSCASCGASQSPDSKFCNQCGAPIRGAVVTVAGEAPARTAARKNVTALFADLVGSTAFAERVDPEAARAALAPYFDILRSSVEDRAGTVVKFTGDGVFAVFGIPEVAEDDALRAVATGVDLQRRFTEFAGEIRERHGVELGLRVGINSGELVIADDDADLVGDVLNTAARLEAECTPGRVLVGEDTWRLTRSGFGYEVLGEVRVKGKAGPVATFQVADHVVAPEEATPFVGREAELALLLAAFEEARDSPVARLVSVIGAPGVGKTRLAHELRSATRARSFDLRLERRGSTTFTPIADLLREVSDGSPEGVDRLFTEHPERTRLVPVLQSFLGHGEPRSTEESFWATRRLLEQLTELFGPLIVVVDDIQWAEPRFWDLLDHLVEWAAAPVLIVALARPELRDLRPELAQPGRRVAAAIALEGLDATSTRELAARLLDTDDLPAELVERIPDTTEGNPLFVRELVQMLVDDGTLARVGDRWRLTIDVDAIEVPPTVLSLLATRVERLPGEERQLVELASVIGTEFDRGTLTAIIPDGSSAGLGAVIDRLRRKDLIEPSGTWAGDHPVYRFHHVLVRDAAYRRLLKGRRAELHESVGRHLERSEVANDDLDVTVAHHFEQVVRFRTELGEADERTAELAKAAVERLRGAAESALAREDLPSAGGYATRALGLVDTDDSERDELLVLACEALLSSGDVAGAAPFVRELHDRSGDERLAAWADCFRAQRWSFTDAERLTEAAELTDDAARRLARLDDQAGVAKARLVRAGCLARLGRVGDCEQELDLALGAARTAGDRRRTVAVLGAAPLAALWGPSPVARAGGRCLDVLRLLRITTASPAVEATSFRCQGMLEALRGRFDSARDKLEQSRSTSRELGLRHALFETELFAGFVELWAEDPAAAERHLRVAHEGLGRLGLGADAGQAAALLARSLHRQGRLDEAEPLAREAVESAGQNLQTAMEARAILAEIRSLQGCHDEARALVDEALAIAERTDDVLDHALVLLAGSRVADAAGEDDRADRFRTDARSLLDNKGVARETSTAANSASLTATDDGPPLRREGHGDTVAADDTPVVDPALGLSNRASALAIAGIGAIERGDLDRARALVDDGFVAELRLRIAAAEQVDREGFLEILVAMVDQGFRTEIEVIAVRGDDLALMRTRQSAELGDTYRVLLAEARGGRLARMVSYDPDLLTEAQVELDRLYFDQVGLSDDHVFRRIGAAAYSLDPGDVAEFLHPCFEYVNHRLLSHEGGGQAALLDAMASEAARADFVVTAPRSFRLDERGLVGERVETAPDGSEIRFVATMAIQDNLISRMELSSLEQLDEALERYDGSGTDDDSGHSDPQPVVTGRSLDVDRSPSNRATRVVTEWHDAMLADLGRARQLGHEDYTYETREPTRLALGYESSGWEDRAEALAGLFEQFGDLQLDRRFIAVRGDDLALSELNFRIEGNAITQYVVHQTRDDRILRSIQFGDGQLVDAQVELDRLYFDAIGLPDEHVYRRMGPAAYTMDPAIMAEFFHPEFEYVEHRLLSYEGGDRNALTEAMASETARAEFVVTIPRILRFEDGCVVVERVEAMPDGSAENRIIGLFTTDAGLLSRFELYSVDQLDTALARFDELASPTPGAISSGPTSADGPLDNEAARLLTRYLDAALRRDRSEMSALLNDDFVYDNRREWFRSMGVGRREREASIEALIGLVDHGLTGFDSEIVAVRGDDLALERRTFLYADSSTVGYSVVESRAGRLVGITRFDPDTLADALLELDERWLARGGPALQIEITARGIRSFLIPGFDLDELPFADDFVTIDHRPVGMGRRDLATFLESSDLLTPSTLIQPQQFGWSDDVAFYEFKVVRHDDDFVWHVLHVTTMDDEGIHTIHVFGLDQFDAAQDLFEALTSTTETAGDRGGATNRAARLARRAAELVMVEGMEPHRDLFAQEFVSSNLRRTYLEHHDDLGAASVSVEFWRHELGWTTVDVTDLAARDNGLCLQTWVARSGAGDEFEQLQLTEIDTDGRILAGIAYDPDQLSEALDELDRRWLALGGPEALVDIAIRGRAAYRSRDAGKFREVLTPGFVNVDHRTLGKGTRSLDEWLVSHRPLIESELGTVPLTIAYAAMSGNTALSHVRLIERSSQATWDLWLIGCSDGDRISRMETFDLTDYEAAVARFEELSKEPQIVTNVGAE